MPTANAAIFAGSLTISKTRSSQLVLSLATASVIGLSAPLAIASAVVFAAALPADMLVVLIVSALLPKSEPKRAGIFERKSEITVAIGPPAKNSAPSAVPNGYSSTNLMSILRSSPA